MLKVLSDQMKLFLQASQYEEPVDQPVYHIQSYGTAGATSFTFFNTATGSATNGLADTNMDAAAVLSAGKRFAVMSIGVFFLAGPAPEIVNNLTPTTLTSYLNDARSVLEGIAWLNFKVLDKTYYTVAPLSYLPAGFGLSVGGAAQANTLQTAANGESHIAHAVNGLPVPSALRKLRVPVPIPQQVRFEVTMNFPTAVTVSTAARIGCVLDGLLIRARQ
jgi:hypothetical protein